MSSGANPDYPTDVSIPVDTEGLPPVKMVAPNGTTGFLSAGDAALAAWLFCMPYDPDAKP